MEIGIPRETRARERRVALTPSGVKALVQGGHTVWVESGAGVAAGHADADYESAGARIAFHRMEALTRAALLACVYAPDPREYEFLQPGQVVFAFWALPAARPEDLRALAAAPSPCSPPDPTSKKRWPSPTSSSPPRRCTASGRRGSSPATCLRV